MSLWDHANDSRNIDRERQDERQNFEANCKTLDVGEHHIEKWRRQDSLGIDKGFRKDLLGLKLEDAISSLAHERRREIEFAEREIAAYNRTMDENDPRRIEIPEGHELRLRCNTSLNTIEHREIDREHLEKHGIAKNGNEIVLNRPIPYHGKGHQEFEHSAARGDPQCAVLVVVAKDY